MIVKTQVELDAAIKNKETDIEIYGSGYFEVSGQSTVRASGQSIVRASGQGKIYQEG